MTRNPEAEHDAQKLLASPVFQEVISSVIEPARHHAIYATTFEKREEARYKVMALDEVLDNVRRIAGVKK
jgi:hypothetical protein